MKTMIIMNVDIPLEVKTFGLKGVNTGIIQRIRHPNTLEICHSQCNMIVH